MLKNLKNRAKPLILAGLIGGLMQPLSARNSFSQEIEAVESAKKAYFISPKNDSTLFIETDFSRIPYQTRTIKLPTTNSVIRVNPKISPDCAYVAITSGSLTNPDINVYSIDDLFSSNYTPTDCVDDRGLLGETRASQFPIWSSDSTLIYYESLISLEEASRAYNRLAEEDVSKNMRSISFPRAEIVERNVRNRRVTRRVSLKDFGVEGQLNSIGECLDGNKILAVISESEGFLDKFSGGLRSPTTWLYELNLSTRESRLLYEVRGGNVEDPVYLKNGSIAFFQFPDLDPKNKAYNLMVRTPYGAELILKARGLFTPYNLELFGENLVVVAPDYHARAVNGIALNLNNPEAYDHSNLLTTLRLEPMLSELPSRDRMIYVGESKK